jgi:MFS transporter, AAHS family, 3-hydroxyphenylpropionic acid transporter
MSTPTRTTLAHAGAVIACCVLGATCEGFDLQSAGLAAGGIVPLFKPSPDQLADFFTASTAGLFVGALIGGRLSDSIGRKKVLIVCIALFGVFSLLNAAASSMNALSWARLLTGLGLGGALPNLLTLTNETSSERRRHANVALVYAGMPLGGGIASLISMLSGPAHWRWLFITGGLAPLLIVPFLVVWARESPTFQRQHTAPAPALAGGIARAGSFTAILAKGRWLPTLLLWLSFFLLLSVLYLLLNWLPTLLSDGGLSKTQAAGAQIGFNLGGALACLWMGQLLEGRFRGLSVATVFIALPLLMLSLSRLLSFNVRPAPVEPIMVLVCLVGCAVLSAQAFLYAAAPATYPALIRGVGVGVAVAIGRLGSIAGPKLGGILKGMGLPSSQVLMYVLPLAVAACVAAIAFASCTAPVRYRRTGQSL